MVLAPDLSLNSTLKCCQPDDARDGNGDEEAADQPNGEEQEQQSDKEEEEESQRCKKCCKVCIYALYYMNL